MKAFFCLLLCSTIACLSLHADTLYIKVHFLYGSKPKREYKESENKWFGGLHGGHVGVELDSGNVIDFVPWWDFHIFSRKRNIAGRFKLSSLKSFWETFGGDSADMKRTTIVIPITLKQKIKLDSIARAYLERSPYDYAFFGMRCGAAACEILSQAGITKPRSNVAMCSRYFYPKPFRKQLLRQAKRNGWAVRSVEGTPRRKWEND